MRENADQNNSEYGHFLRSVEHSKILEKYGRCIKKEQEGKLTRSQINDWTFKSLQPFFFSPKKLI